MTAKPRLDELRFVGADEPLVLPERPAICPSCGSPSRLTVRPPCSLDQCDPDEWHSFSAAAEAHDEPTVASVLGLLSDAVDLLDGAAVVLAEVRGPDRDRLADALDQVWQAWGHAERGRAALTSLTVVAGP